ncbi:hypothetical protein ACMYR3_03780 [Ampullimonas aquatilis]|uniref:hypothetical protein n=1 Tax=Ampullimonas aquatilis TaxID=1341549 RepID=UPI003C7121F1
MTSYDTANLGAVGMISTGFVPVDPFNGVQNPGNNAYRFIKINGSAPTLLNVVEGTYELYAETSFQYRNTISGNLQTIFDLMPRKLGDPTIIDDIDNGIRQYWGRSGLLALPSNGYSPVIASGTTISSADITANPVNTYTKSPNGPPDNCQPPLPTANTDLFSKP